MTDNSHNYNKSDNQQQWTMSSGCDQAQLWDDSVNNAAHDIDIKQDNQSMKSNSQMQNSSDFWASLTGDAFTFPPNDMDVTSSAGTFDPYSSYSESTAATSVEPNTEKFQVAPGFQGFHVLERDVVGLNHCVAVKPDDEGDWLQGLCTGVSRLSRSDQQLDTSNTCSDIGTMMAESDLDMDWPLAPGSERVWEQDTVGICGPGDFSLDTDFGQSNSYPPLPDLAPLTEFDTFATHAVDQNTNPFSSHWPDPELNDFSQHHDQAVIPSIESNGHDLTWNTSQPQYRESSISSTPGRASQTSSTRKAEDEFLLDCKDRRKMSYRAIKALGGFREAESTLRGRYRTLSKLKEERVRKPEWSERDILILKHVVADFLRKSSSLPPDQFRQPYSNVQREQQYVLNRISWKRVAESMAMRGCYKFGNATVKKKYLEIMGIAKRTKDN